MQLELAPERLDEPRERVLIACPGPFEVDAHRVNDTRSAGNGPRSVPRQHGVYAVQ
jgi:hypothetical protein